MSIQQSFIGMVAKAGGQIKAAEKLDKSDLTGDEKAALANILAAGLQAGSEVEGFLLGSETQKVLTHSSIPVLVYR